MTSTWEWRHVKADITHEANPDWYGIREQQDGGKLEASCINCEEVVVAFGSGPEENEPVARPGYWSVENGIPYWVDSETKAHFHPGIVETDLNWATSRYAWSELADMIWFSRHPR